MRNTNVKIPIAIFTFEKKKWSNLHNILSLTPDVNGNNVFFLFKSKYNNKGSKINFHFFSLFLILKRNAISGFYFDVSDFIEILS